MKKHIPNLITGCNLISGAVATFLATQGAFQAAFVCICLGAFFDFFDGMTARKLGVSGPLGVQMDSLADDITFGLAPAMLVSCYLRPIIGWWCMLALIMAGFSALRLAKFNIDTRQTTSFIGLATPANAIFWGGICSMPYAVTTGSFMPWAMLAMTFVSCYLLICEIPFFSLKMKNLSWHSNYVRYIFLLGCVAIIVFCIIEAIRYHETGYALFAGTVCIIWYFIVNVIQLLTDK